MAFGVPFWPLCGRCAMPKWSRTSSKSTYTNCIQFKSSLLLFFERFPQCEATIGLQRLVFISSLWTKRIYDDIWWYIRWYGHIWTILQIAYFQDRVISSEQRGSQSSSNSDHAGPVAAAHYPLQASRHSESQSHGKTMENPLEKRWEWGASNPLNNGKNRCFHRCFHSLGPRGITWNHGIREIPATFTWPELIHEHQFEFDDSPTWNLGISW